MTTNKYNRVAKCTYLSKYPETFRAIMDAAQKQFGKVLDSMSARQIAGVLEFGYAQREYGELHAK